MKLKTKASAVVELINVTLQTATYHNPWKARGDFRSELQLLCQMSGL